MAKDVPEGQTFPEWLKDKGPGGSASRSERMAQLGDKFKQVTDTEWQLRGQTYVLPPGMGGQREQVYAYCLYRSHGGTGDFVPHA